MNLISSTEDKLQRKPFDSFRDDVIHGLKRFPKALSPKYFYDERGSRLFDAICETEEYYPTRTEIGILKKESSTILKSIKGSIRLIELGSGSSLKTRYLLGATDRISGYIPIDISKEHLLNSAQSLRARFPDIPIYPLAMDYTYLTETPLPPTQKGEQSLVFFPGSTLGNLDRVESEKLFANVRSLLHDKGFFLIGIDLVKNVEVLEAAYNDSENVTAAFNMNLLRRINTELGGNFDLSAFQHQAFFNISKNRIEMHLKSLRPQVVTIDDVEIFFEKGESIHTESSQKYEIEQFKTFAARQGFTFVRHWTDEDDYFALVLLQTSSFDGPA